MFSIEDYEFKRPGIFSLSNFYIYSLVFSSRESGKCFAGPLPRPPPAWFQVKQIKVQEQKTMENIGQIIRKTTQKTDMACFYTETQWYNIHHIHSYLHKPITVPMPDIV